MAVNRVVVTLEQFEYTGLLKVAGKELRDPHEQMRWLLRQELERRGLLAATNGRRETGVKHAPASR